MTDNSVGIQLVCLINALSVLIKTILGALKTIWKVVPVAISLQDVRMPACAAILGIKKSMRTDCVQTTFACTQELLHRTPLFRPIQTWTANSIWARYVLTKSKCLSKLILMTKYTSEWNSLET